MDNDVVEYFVENGLSALPPELIVANVNSREAM